jgi:hypothetical protein
MPFPGMVSAAVFALNSESVQIPLPKSSPFLPEQGGNALLGGVGSEKKFSLQDGILQINGSGDDSSSSSSSSSSARVDSRDSVSRSPPNFPGNDLAGTSDLSKFLRQAPTIRQPDPLTH